MTIRLILLELLATIARALLEHGCGEILRLAMHYMVPSIPPFVCIAFGLVFSVTMIEVAAMLWRRRTG
jgi:hypothetical protein